MCSKFDKRYLHNIRIRYEWVNNIITHRGVTINIDLTIKCIDREEHIITQTIYCLHLIYYLLYQCLYVLKYQMSTVLRNYVRKTGCPS